MIYEVKIHFMAMESGGIEESVMTVVSGTVKQKAISAGILFTMM